ncbi:hypothetical protein, partial [Thalassospira sp.]|uniref:hypothetical protein n=1 Tax=Thalassospira sp. TaxID=1912094 RepID=UPI00258068EE
IEQISHTTSTNPKAQSLTAESQRRTDTMSSLQLTEIPLSREESSLDLEPKTATRQALVCVKLLYLKVIA